MIIATSVFATQARAQFTPLAIGTATVDSGSASCPASAGWLTGGTCEHLTISDCPYAQPLGVTIDYVPPSGTNLGTIVFLNDGGGEGPNTETGQETTFASTYLLAGYGTVQTSWDSDWENTNVPGDGGLPYVTSILAAACRPATLLSTINGSPTFHPAGAMCAQGASAGSAQVAYSLVWYDAKTYLNNVELLSGPVFSSVLKGCKAKPSASNVTVCGSGQYGCNNEYGNTTSWTNPPQYVGFYLNDVQGWVAGTGTSSCRNPSGTSSLANESWLNMSIVNTSGGDFSFPNTSVAGWVCAGAASNYQSGTCGNSHCPNNSGSQGALFHQQFSSGNHPLHYAFTGINGCNGEEGVSGTYAVTPNGGSAMTAIQTDMKNFCVAP